MRKIILPVFVMFGLLLAVGSVSATGGFDQYGYNDTARIFNGTGSSWCLGGGQAADCMGAYSNDKLVMKWNAAWDTCNAGGDCTGAWTNNEWNGAVKGGSGAVWKYKIVWVGDYTANPSLIPAGAYGVWGEYATIMDQGKDPSYGAGHLWFAHANPTGYGAFK